MSDAAGCSHVITNEVTTDLHLLYTTRSELKKAEMLPESVGTEGTRIQVCSCCCEMKQRRICELHDNTMYRDRKQVEFLSELP